MLFNAKNVVIVFCDSCECLFLDNQWAVFELFKNIDIDTNYSKWFS